MKIAQLYKFVLYMAADNADNYPDVFEVGALQLAFGTLEDLRRAIRDDHEDYLDDYVLMSTEFDKDYLLRLFDTIMYIKGENSYIDVLLEDWEDL